MIAMKRAIVRMAAALLTAVLFFPSSVQALSAQNAILLDATTDRVLLEKNADKRALIASTTKIMTALIVCEQCNVLDRMRIPKEAVGIEGSSMYLQEGEILTIQDLLYGLMLHSGNDAAVALAIYCGGTVEGFAQLMNDKAHRLGMENTHFVNPNGLDNPNHYSTARDLAILAAYAMDNPIFAHTVSTKTVTVGKRTLRNHNKLLWRFEGADGVKTGFTKAAGRILVSSATRQNRRLIAVTINDRNDWADHAKMLEDGFSRYSLEKIVCEGECLGSVDIFGGEEDTAFVYASEDFSYPLASNEEAYVVLQEPGFVYAPIAFGQDAGYAYICIGEKTIGKVHVYYGQTTEIIKEEKRSIWDRLFMGN